MKHHRASSGKIQKTTGGTSAKKPLKSQNQQRPSSVKKRTEGDEGKQGQKRKVIVILCQIN